MKNNGISNVDSGLISVHCGYILSKTILRYHNYLKMFIRNKDIFYSKYFKKRFQNNKIIKNDKH